MPQFELLERSEGHALAENDLGRSCDVAVAGASFEADGPEGMEIDDENAEAETIEMQVARVLLKKPAALLTKLNVLADEVSLSQRHLQRHISAISEHMVRMQSQVLKNVIQYIKMMTRSGTLVAYLLCTTSSMMRRQCGCSLWLVRMRNLKEYLM